MFSEYFSYSTRVCVQAHLEKKKVLKCLHINTCSVLNSSSILKREYYCMLNVHVWRLWIFFAFLFRDGKWFCFFFSPRELSSSTCGRQTTRYCEPCRRNRADDSTLPQKGWRLPSRFDDGRDRAVGLVGVPTAMEEDGNSTMGVGRIQGVGSKSSVGRDVLISSGCPLKPGNKKHVNTKKRTAIIYEQR